MRSSALAPTADNSALLTEVDPGVLSDSLGSNDALEMEVARRCSIDIDGADYEQEDETED